MSEQTKGINALSANAAYNLANVTKTKPQYGALTPKWLTKLLEFKGLETGIYRVNKVVEGETPLDVLCSQTKKSDIIPDGYVEGNIFSLIMEPESSLGNQQLSETMSKYIRA